MRVVVVLILSLMLSLSAIAAIENPVVLKLIDQQETEKAILNFDIKPGWYVYGADPGELGLPLNIYSTNSYVKVTLPPPVVKKEEINGEVIKTRVYLNSFQAVLDYGYRNSEYQDVHINVEYGACKDICIKLNDSFKIEGKSYTIKVIASIIFFAVIGGFILNLMPCVLPVLSLKLLGFVKYSHLPHSKVRKHLLTCSLGICSSFIALGVLTSVLKVSGTSLGWGFHFQNPIFIVFVAIILILFASYLWDEAGIQVPKFVQNLGANNNSYKGSFLTGAFATLLATPCTGPFLGTSVAFALSQSFIMIFVIYLAIGVGMSLPYIVVAANSNLIKLLPKPGKWMVYTKKTFAILLLLSSFWFLYVLMAHYTFNTFLIIVGMILLIKFALTNIRSTKWSFVVALFLFASLLGSLPHIENKFEVDEASSDKLWQPFNLKQLNHHVDRGDVVLVDFTAKWCAGCMLNKVVTLSRPDVEYYLREHKIILMRADLTKSKFDSEVGEFLSLHGSVGIPLNVMYGPNNKKGIVLPLVLSKSDIVKAYTEVVANTSSHF